jgi:hypothetical protein
MSFMYNDSYGSGKNKLQSNLYSGLPSGDNSLL